MVYIKQSEGKLNNDKGFFVLIPFVHKQTAINAAKEIIYGCYVTREITTKEMDNLLS